ncbi:MAG: hypothetical protein ACYDD6_05895, partial [Acidimicrobiales bacterium]
MRRARSAPRSGLDEGAAAATDAPSTQSRQLVLLSYLMGPAAFVTLLALRHFGVIAHSALWLYVVVFVSIPALSMAADHRYRRRPSRTSLHLRVAVHAAAVTAVIFMSGWGSVLIGAYAFIALENISASGSRVWRVTASWSLLGIAAGEL